MLERATVLRKTQSLCPQCGEETISAVAKGKSPALLRDHAGVIEAEIVESGVRFSCESAATITANL